MPKPKIPSRSVTPGVPRPTPLAPTRPLIRPRTPNAIRVQQAPRPELAPKIIQSNNKYSNSAAKLPAKFKSSGREVSPLVRSQTPFSSNPVGFSDHGETQPPPPNLRTNRSSSASRGRPLNPTSATLIHPKQESVVTPRRQSCSPTLARGRKTEDNNILVDKNSMKEKNLVGGNGSLVFGSKMVEKVMNARKSIPVVQEKEVKLKARITMHESSGFGGMKSKSSLHMPLKHMEIKRDPSNPRQVQSANSSIPDGVKSNSNLSNQASQVQVTWRSKGVGRFQSKE
ncbi:hypothetical protein Sjap_008091 [Stephania japonica]|uniref:Uncharacterized protein n=1 Tax=Stephania japonica TaxID=461633 RepID=A0AAP0PB11_9MAGN